MRFRTIDPNRPPEAELIAQFGEARLVKRMDGKLELKGGSEKDRAEARKWVAAFLRKPVADSGRETAGPPDSHHLRAAVGWLELGNHVELARLQF